MRSLLLLSLLLMTQACATFESGDLPLLEQWPPSAAAAPATVAFEIEGLPKKFHAGWQRKAGEVLMASGRFSNVVAGAEQQAQARMHFDFEWSRPPLPVTRTWMALCAMTAGIVPARAAWDFEVRASVFGADGKQLGVIERSVGAETWIGWVMIFALPFAGAGTSSLMEDTTRSIVLEAIERGLF